VFAAAAMTGIGTEMQQLGVNHLSKRMGLVRKAVDILTM
jgi:hypothetical protein